MKILFLMSLLALSGCVATVPGPVGHQCALEMRSTRTPMFRRGLLDVIEDQQFYDQCVQMGAR